MFYWGSQMITALNVFKAKEGSSHCICYDGTINVNLTMSKGLKCDSRSGSCSGPISH